jgi:hypothetical protein
MARKKGRGRVPAPGLKVCSDGTLGRYRGALARVNFDLSGTSTMISLDDEQLGIIVALAAPLHPTRRGPFLQAVMQEAAKHDAIGPGLINRIASAVQRTFLFANPMATTPGPAGATRQHERQR